MALWSVEGEQTISNKACGSVQECGRPGTQADYGRTVEGIWVPAWAGGLHGLTNEKASRP